MSTDRTPAVAVESAPPVLVRTILICWPPRAVYGFVPGFAITGAAPVKTDVAAMIVAAASAPPLSDAVTAEIAPPVIGVATLISDALRRALAGSGKPTLNATPLVC